MNKMHGSILLFVLLVLGSVFAQTELIHTADYYAVSFDGEGDAIVRAKMNIENIGKETISKLKLEFPERTKIYRIVQQEAFETIDFDMEYGSDNSLATVYLAETLQPNENTSLVLFFKSSETAEKDFLGNLDFDFKTIVDRQAVLTERVRVSVSMQKDFFLKNGEHETEFKPDFFNEASMAKMASMSEREIMPYIDAIEYDKGQMVEETFNLDAFESFHVKGKYSENYIALYANEVLIGLAILLVIGIIAVSRRKKGKN